MTVPVTCMLPAVLEVPVLCVLDKVEVAGEESGLFVVGWDFPPEFGDGLGSILLPVAARLEVGIDHIEVAHGGVLKVDPHKSSLHYMVDVPHEDWVEGIQEVVSYERDNSCPLLGVV